MSYTRAYLFLLGRLKKCNDIKNTYKKILESPREALNIMKEFSKDKAENYYSIIKELENEYDFNIITTKTWYSNTYIKRTVSPSFVNNYSRYNLKSENITINIYLINIHKKNYMFIL